MRAAPIWVARHHRLLQAAVLVQVGAASSASHLQLLPERAAPAWRVQDAAWPCKPYLQAPVLSVASA